MINVPLLKRLCMANGISGDEGAVRELIIEEIKGYADYKIDALGNLLVHKKGKKPAQNRLMLSAHMDEVSSNLTRWAALTAVCLSASRSRSAKTTSRA